MVALIAALWAYDGWNDLNMVAGEVRNPERNVPLALLFGVGIVGFLYISVNAAIQYMLPAVAVAASPRPAVAAVSVVLGATGATLVTAGMALSIFVTLNGTIMSGARVPFAAARDGLFFSRIAELSPRFGTPAPSLVLQASLSTLLLLAVGRFQQLFELAIFAEWLFYMIATTTIFVHRRRGTQESAATFRMWGYPVLPALFIAAAAVLLVYSYQSNLRNSLLGSAIIAGGIPLFYFFKRKQPS
jgi:APA family basic amino acid/polyamine antiporter